MTMRYLTLAPAFDTVYCASGVTGPPAQSYELLHINPPLKGSALQGDDDPANSGDTAAVFVCLPPCVMRAPVTPDLGSGGVSIWSQGEGGESQL